MLGKINTLGSFFSDDNVIYGGNGDASLYGFKRPNQSIGFFYDNRYGLLGSSGVEMCTKTCSNMYYNNPYTVLANNPVSANAIPISVKEKKESILFLIFNPSTSKIGVFELKHGSWVQSGVWVSIGVSRGLHCGEFVEEKNGFFFTTGDTRYFISVNGILSNLGRLSKIHGSNVGIGLNYGAWKTNKYIVFRCGLGFDFLNLENNTWTNISNYSSMSFVKYRQRWFVFSLGRDNIYVLDVTDPNNFKQVIVPGNFSSLTNPYYILIAHNPNMVMCGRYCVARINSSIYQEIPLSKIIDRAEEAGLEWENI